MKISIAIITFLVVVFAVIYYLTGYRSAFEADQACHFLKSSNYQDSKQYGCDHDLETNQWILFRSGEGEDPAIVVKRFRY